MLITKQLPEAIDFHSSFSILYKSVVTFNCFVTNILQNILFYAQRKKETHTGVKQLES